MVFLIEISNNVKSIHCDVLDSITFSSALALPATMSNKKK